LINVDSTFNPENTMKGSPAPPPAYVSSREAVRILGIKPESLYAYVSRGWIRSIAEPNGTRGRFYSKTDIDKVLARQRARAGHGPAAASAVRWGEPILESSITEISDAALRYRGRDVIADLARPNVPFENVAEWLWSGTWVEPPIVWKRERDRADWRRVFTEAAKLPDPKHRMAAYLSGLTLAGVKEPDVRYDQTVALGRAVLVHLASLLTSSRSRPSASATGISIASTIAGGWNIHDEPRVRSLNQLLVVCADHELNTSAFVARVAASNGAFLLLCLEAALATHRGTRQGLSSDLLENLVTSALKSRKAGQPLSQVLREYSAAHGKIPGFGHPFYPAGDPRARFLLEMAHAFGTPHSGLQMLNEMAQWMHGEYAEEPNLDSGLLAMQYMLGLPRRSASTLYCFSRIAGWIAHILEQRTQGFQIRPRAKYVAHQVPLT
jgi:citrate synthase